MKKANPIITGTTGMVGKGVLLECLDSPLVEKVLVVNRRSIEMNHPKLKEVLVEDFFDLSLVEEDLAGYNACFFCAGVSAAGISKEKYHRLTYEMTVHFAEAVQRQNGEVVFTYVSGQGTSTAEDSRMHWANVKGKTENRLLEMFAEVYMFRPGYIQPIRGVKSATGWYNAMYVVFKPLYPILKKIAPNHLTDSVKVGRAMINVTAKGFGKKWLENRDINEAAALSHSQPTVRCPHLIGHLFIEYLHL